MPEARDADRVADPGGPLHVYKAMMRDLGTGWELVVWGHDMYKRHWVSHIPIEKPNLLLGEPLREAELKKLLETEEE